MAIQTALDPVEDLIDEARRVLPGGGFGNVSPRGDHRRRAGRPRLGRERQRVRRLPAGLRPDDSSAMPTPRWWRSVQAQVPPRAPRSSPTTSTASAWPPRSSTRWPAPRRCASSAPARRPTLYAMRVARAYRGRDKILKFEGGYHGMSDYGLMSLAPKRAGNFPAADPGFGRHPQERCATRCSSRPSTTSRRSRA